MGFGSPAWPSAIPYINKTTVKWVLFVSLWDHERMETLKVQGLCDGLTGFIWVKHPSPPQPGLKQRKQRSPRPFQSSYPEPECSCSTSMLPRAILEEPDLLLKQMGSS